MKFICFDLEGPLSPQDNAYELMKRIPDGDRVFEVISRYDDLLTLKGRKGYEPGDTLALIVPFLIYHGVSEDGMREASQRATLVDGARSFVAELVDRGWWVGCITTCYEQHGYPVTQRIGIPWQNVACTRFPLDKYRKAFRKEDFSEVRGLEKDILMMRPVEDDENIEERLDSFYWGTSANANVRAIVKRVKPVGGKRKLKVLRTFARTNQLSLDKTVVVGDSITDFRMLEAVNQAGGLAIAFNANEYALPYANVGLASTHLSDLSPVLEAWEKGGKEAAKVVVKQKEMIGGVRDRDHFHWLEGVKDLTPILEIHRRIRRLVREAAAKLG